MDSSDPSSAPTRPRKKIDAGYANEALRVSFYFGANEANELREKRQSGTISSTLLSKGLYSRNFFTEDSHRYITPEEARNRELLALRRVERLTRFDSAQLRYARPAKSVSEELFLNLKQRYGGIASVFAKLPEMVSLQISPVRAWNASLVGAVFFGMFAMTLIYRSLGQQVSAENQVAQAPTSASSVVAQEGAVLGVSDERIALPETPVSEKTPNASAPPPAAAPPPPKPSPEQLEKERFESEARELVKGYPIESMLPYIFKQDPDVAAFLIAIGKKESNWGKRVPVLDGADCYNYWGYRGIRDKMGSGGHTCFDNREDAVKTVAKRIKTLVQEKKLDTPAKMIAWKCGSTCKGHSPEGVRKWIADVDMYIRALE